MFWFRSSPLSHTRPSQSLKLLESPTRTKEWCRYQDSKISEWLAVVNNGGLHAAGTQAALIQCLRGAAGAGNPAANLSLLTIVYVSMLQKDQSGSTLLRREAFGA